MKKLITQFDSQKQGVYVTTPSCCGCCCCCCCSLATSITSSTLLARRINHEAKKQNDPKRGLYVALAALYLPVAGFAAYLLIMFLDKTIQTCRTYTRQYTGYSPVQVYERCVSPIGQWYWIVAVAAFVGLLAFLYAAVKMKRPVVRAILVVAAIAVLMVGEATAGAFLILSSAGIGYLIAIPFIFALVYKLYDATFGKDVASKPVPAWPAVGSITPAYPEDAIARQPGADTQNTEETDDAWKNTLK